MNIFKKIIAFFTRHKASIVYAYKVITELVLKAEELYGPSSGLTKLQYVLAQIQLYYKKIYSVFPNQAAIQTVVSGIVSTLNATKIFKKSDV